MSASKMTEMLDLKYTLPRPKIVTQAGINAQPITLQDQPVPGPDYRLTRWLIYLLLNLYGNSKYNLVEELLNPRKMFFCMVHYCFKNRFA